MAEQIDTSKDARDQIWKQLGDNRVSMLSIHGSSQHPQPMTHFVDRDAGCLWFITSAETDLARAIDTVAPGELVFMAPSQDYQASIRGNLEIVPDREKLDELWSVPVAAWFREGREDPDIRLLRFTPDEAAIWASQSSKVLVGMKLLRAGLSEGADAPDIGVHRIIDFKAAA